jgi:hydroxyacylglutathione hydrolase
LPNNIRQKKYIFETHFHADFVSGHLDLSKQTGAPIVYGPKTEANFPFHLAKDGEIFKIGNITLEVIHTPGHTLESTCYLLKDESEKPYCIFTGDTLFVGDVRRPDLSSGHMTSEQLASIMYDTIQDKLVPLADDIIVYPTHGPGTGCGKNIGPETITTIGEQKKNNYALQPQTREEFIAAFTRAWMKPFLIFQKIQKLTKKDIVALMKLKEKDLLL